MRPAIEDHAQKVRRPLLRELTCFLEGPSRGGRVGVHAELAEEHHQTDLRVGLVDLASELERFLRDLERLLRIGLRGDFRLGSFDRRERAVALRSEEHTSELQSRTLISYAVFCLKK